jgi:hypothetical protein
MKKKINIAVYIVGGIILFVGLILGAGILILNLTDCDPGERNTSYPEYVEIDNNESGSQNALDNSAFSIDDVVFTPYKHELSDPSKTVFGVSATSKSSAREGRIGHNIVLQDIEEAIIASFWHTGKDRKMQLSVYYDYVAVPFRVGTYGEYKYNYEFDIKMNMKIQIPLYLSETTETDSLVHRIIFVFTPGYDEYAKDKDSVSFNSSTVQMYQLHYGNYQDDEDAEYVDFYHEYENSSNNFSQQTLPLMLNTSDTDYSNIDSTGIPLPQKFYKLSNVSYLDMDCIVGNTTEPVQTALVFVQVGGKAAKVNGKDFIVVNLDSFPMTVCDITFELPTEQGLFDIIGFVVYEPFSYMMYGETSFPQVSNRFTIEIS